MMKHVHRYEVCQNKRYLHTDSKTHITRHPICAPQHHVSQIPSVCKHLHNENSPVRTGTRCHRKKKQPLAWATRRPRPCWACRSRHRSGGCRGSARRARWCRTTLGDHVVRRLVCVVFSLHFSSRISRIACDFVRFFAVLLMIRSGLRFGPPKLPKGPIPSKKWAPKGPFRVDYRRSGCQAGNGCRLTVHGRATRAQKSTERSAMRTGCVARTWRARYAHTQCSYTPTPLHCPPVPFLVLCFVVL